MQAEVERAKERATLRHRTTGKWARAMRNKGEMDEEDIGAVKILQDRAELLRRKIAGGEESSDDDDSRGEERDIQELEELAQAESPAQAKGIMGMKFMRDAAARADREAGVMADETRLEMLGLQLDSGTENWMGDDAVGGNLGRRIYRPGQIRQSTTYSDISSTLKSSQSPESLMDTRTSLPPIPESPSPTIPLSLADSNVNTEPSGAPNPWLAVTSSSSKIARKNNVAQVTKMQKAQAKTEEERARVREDATVEIDMSEVLAIPDHDKAESDAGSSQRTVKAKAVDATFIPSDDEASDTDEKAPAAFKQRELVAMAFAGDNVVEDFAAEKRRVIEEDAPKEVDTTLVGWGSWGGRGTKKQAPRPNLIKKIAGVDASKRADAGKKHIIISEKKDKKASKYLVKDLPYPYTSKEQFARSMATPIGTEWNTRVAHQRAVLPRVVKKMGIVIDPLERMF
ncbi:U3 small nucleolar RNA-associated protein 14 [Rhizoctonia solani]|uniref:U3 small nucleolar RNA-associated protein 14 n=1 Tax=Rhizoctonia solani TaxID=456999 RepID=A0A0K6GGV7_9AGAM|nr:U3 small nucleolar RNA-associated protein 14 [Rhizoctonia solani]